MRYLFIFIIAFILAACNRANYQHALSKEVVQGVIEHHIQDSSQVVKEEKETASSHENTETKTVKIEFDTDKPADPQTGLPPIKSVAITDTQTKGQNNSEKAINTQIQTAIQENTNLAINEEREAEVIDENTTEVLKPPSFLKSMLYILAIVGFYFLHDWIRKNWKKIKMLWR